MISEISTVHMCTRKDTHPKLLVEVPPVILLMAVAKCLDLLQVFCSSNSAGSTWLNCYKRSACMWVSYKCLAIEGVNPII